MPEESYSFAQTKIRLEEIVAQVRKKDVSLEKSLDLLEEGVRLANQCTELIDHADWDAAGGAEESPEAGDGVEGARDEASSGEAAEQSEVPAAEETGSQG